MSDGFSALRPRPSLVGALASAFCADRGGCRDPLRWPLSFSLPRSIIAAPWRLSSSMSFALFLKPLGKPSEIHPARHATDDNSNHRRFAVVPPGPGLGTEPKFTCW